MQFSKIVNTSVLTLALLNFTGWTHAQSVEEIANQGNRIMQGDFDQNLMPQLRQIIEDSNRAKDSNYDLEFLKRGIERVTPDQSRVKKTDDKERVYIFASRGQPEKELKDLFSEAAADKRVSVVFRGIFPNESLSEGMRDIHRILRDAKLGEPPSIVIDPTLFEKFSVNTSPVVVLARGDELLAKANGSYAVQWLEREHKVNNREGFLGTYGTTVPIAEPSLIELMKLRLASIDFREKKENIIKTYWSKYRFQKLSPAREDSERIMDPSFEVGENIYDAKGEILVAKGTKFSPLEQMPFSKKLVVFNANNKLELDYVDRIVHGDPAPEKLILITTELHTEDGWDQKVEIEARLRKPIYLLTGDIRQRFDLRATPSIVTADEKYFYVHEHQVIR